MTASGTLRDRVQAIVIGASAGGVEALSVLLPSLRLGMRAPVFIAMHLPRERPSLLTDIFSSRCALPVREAEDKEPALPATVYFAPPDYHLLLEDGPRIALSVDELVHYSRPSIDVLFQSAADVFGESLMGIILSGANEDGAEGLKTIHDCGGVTVVQEPTGAYESRMINAALGACQPHFVLSLDAMASLLSALEVPG
ncbi:MAG TPA: chemotaxis protein CheB [Steroidobacteraceae bacterium]|jgi:two-component system chemotaxis response regulator CheB